MLSSSFPPQAAVRVGSSLPVEQARARLAAGLSKPGRGDLSRAPMIGRVRGDRLLAYPRAWHRSAAVLRGRIRPAGSGSVVEGTLTAPRIALLVVAGTAVAVVVTAVGLVAGGVSRSALDHLGVAVLCLGIACGWLPLGAGFRRDLRLVHCWLAEELVADRNPGGDLVAVEGYPGPTANGQ